MPFSAVRFIVLFFAYGNYLSAIMYIAHRTEPTDDRWFSRMTVATFMLALGAIMEKIENR